MVNYIHFPELDSNAPRIGGRNFPYVKGIQLVHFKGASSVMQTREEVKYFNITKYLASSLGTNLAVERLSNLKKRGCKFIGYGFLDNDNKNAREVISYLSQDYYIMVEKEKFAAQKAVKEEASKVAAEAAKQAERQAIIADLKQELREEKESEKKDKRQKA